MNRIVIYPYKMGSVSAKALQQSLREKGKEVVRVYPDRGFKPRVDDFVVNWGSSVIPNWGGAIETAINHPVRVSASSDKLVSFIQMSRESVSVPPFTTDISEARRLVAEGVTMFARTLTRASGGRGIVICTDPTQVPRANLYTKYIEKDAEYRVHIFKGECIDYAKKIQRNEDATDDQNMVGNHDNGWYFLRDVERIEDNIELAKKAIEALGLDFGAVDIIRKDKVSYVLEVNSAPGLEGISLEAYAQAIINANR